MFFVALACLIIGFCLGYAYFVYTDIKDERDKSHWDDYFQRLRRNPEAVEFVDSVYEKAQTDEAVRSISDALDKKLDVDSKAYHSMPPAREKATPILKAKKK